MATGTPRHTWTDHTTLITAAKLNELEQDVADALATANAAGSGGGTYTDEQAQDAAATLLAGQTGKVSANYVDGANRVDLNVTGLTKSDVGLGNVDNTADTAKPVSAAQQTALASKANTSHTHPVTDLTATGTRSATTFLRGDNTWATPAAGGASYTDEQVRDVMGAALVAGSNVTITPNDAGDTITIAASGGGGGSGQTVYNVVTTYGADKTGAVDAGSAIQAAIDAASTAGGGVVYLPAGTYAISATLTLKSRVTLKGDGLDASTILQSSTTAAGVTATDQIDMVLEDLTVYGPESGTGTGLNFARSTADSVAGITLRRISVGGFGTAIAASNPILCTFDRVSVTNGTTGFNIHGINGGAAGTSVTFLNTFAAGFTQSGYRIDTMTYCAFVGTAADDCGIAYEVIACQGVAFTGCGTESDTNRSTNYPGYGWKITGSVGVSLDGCFTYDMPNTSVWVTGNAAAVKVGGFSENTPRVAATNSIKVDTGCTAVLEAVATVKPLSLALGTTSQIKVNGTSSL